MNFEGVTYSVGQLINLVPVGATYDVELGFQVDRVNYSNRF